MTIAPPRPDRTDSHIAFPGPAPIGRLAISVEEAAERLGISRTSAYLACQRGELPSRLIGRRRVVPLAALERCLDALNGPDVA